MNLADRLSNYASDFELTKADGEWGRVAKHFHPDATRIEHEPPLLSLNVQGRVAIVEQWQEMVERFDRQFDYAFVKPLGVPTVDGNQVSLRWVGIYAMDSAPAMFGEGKEIAQYEDGLITHLQTTMTAETIQRNLDWYAKYADLLPQDTLTYAMTLAPKM